jgi:gamma-glutamyl phosphate reductase
MTRPTRSPFSSRISRYSCDDRNAALASVAQALEKHKEAILTANQKDKDAAATNKIDAPLLKRLDVSSASKFQVAVPAADVSSLYSHAHFAWWCRNV